jgi:hypothetical protein
VAIGRKPVIVRKFSREWLAGYAAHDDLGSTPELELLDLTGKVNRVSWEQVKWVCAVRELPSGESSNPERLLRRRFSVKPRSPGVWLRITLLDGEELEGLAENDRSLLVGAGVFVTPPDTRSNTQRVFIPRTAIDKLELLAVIQSPSSRKPKDEPQQPELFANESASQQ